MKSIRNKKTSNSSFLSNHDLLENFRNKSFKLITRQASASQLKQAPKKVSLIQKKNYHEQSKDNKENDQLLSNRKIANQSKGQTQRQKISQQVNPQQQIQKVIKQLNFIYDQINMDEIELKMILNKNIRKIKEIFGKFTQNSTQKDDKTNQKQELKEKLCLLSEKFEDQSKKMAKYKKQCHDLKDKLNLSQKQIISLQSKLEEQKYQSQEFRINANSQIASNNKFTVHHSQALIQEKKHITKQNQSYQASHEQEQPNQPNQIEILQNIIQTQQELINKQMSDFQAQNQQFLRILHTQALQLQQLILNHQTTSDRFQKVTPKHALNDQRSTNFQTKYDSSTTHRRPIVNGFSQYNSPQRTEDLISKISKKKAKPGDLSICLY